MYIIVFPITLFISLNIYQWIAKNDYSFTSYIIQNLTITTIALITGFIAYLITKKYLLNTF
ncbi:hypothetical protein CO726_30660 [Bacillus fungorum]|uniref:Uncharacterized protein n=1 Tax=Bacillus fungorum TaxID=2039284 RepID=A0A2G6Q4H4_9BACI|nr:hypothetical protein CO726_30660 [Bacillus fungorum]